jgi:hypothetical protein
MDLSKATRFIPFQFAADCWAIIEVSQNMLRVWIGDRVVKEHRL